MFQRRSDPAVRRDTPALQRDIDATGPVDLLGSKCPDAVEQLGQLDDLVFDAIAGKPGAIDQLRLLWPHVKSQVGPNLLEESREAYLSHALYAWRECTPDDHPRNPVLAMAAMDVMTLLFEG